MYIKKLEYLRKKYEEKDLHSGVIIKSVASLPIGTPCIVNLNVSTKKKSTKDTDAKIELEFRDGEVARFTEEKYSSRNSTPANMIFLFNTFIDSPDITDYSDKAHKVCYIEDTPLIYDSYNSTFLESSKKDIISDDIFEQIKEQLKNNRFVNYVFRDVQSTNVKNVIFSIKKIVKRISEYYKNSISFYYYSSKGSRILVDIVSISFYRIKDVIPVFNIKKSEGICMEILMTNSDLGDKEIIKRGYSMTYKFLFTKYRENIFSIDGELVKRPNDACTEDILSFLYRLLNKSAPITEKFKSSKKVVVESKSK